MNKPNKELKRREQWKRTDSISGNCLTIFNLSRLKADGLIFFFLNYMPYNDKLKMHLGSPTIE